MSAVLVVYDTMIFLQAAVNPRRQYASMKSVEDGRLTLCMSRELMDEVEDVLARPLLASKFPALTPNRVAQFAHSLKAFARWFPDVPPLFTLPRHPDDDHLFNLAIHAKADYLVTWETRILKLATEDSAAANLLRQSAPTLKIITPKQLAELLGPDPSSK